MARRYKKPPVSSKLKKIPPLDWGPESRNINTIRKIVKANFDEKEEII